MDKEIKKSVREGQRRGFRDFVKDLEVAPANRAVGVISRMIKARARNRVDRSETVERIRPSEFTEFVASQHNPKAGEAELAFRRFELEERWQADVEASVARAPRNKATGSDEIFAELFSSVQHWRLNCCISYGSDADRLALSRASGLNQSCVPCSRKSLPFSRGIGGR